MSDDLTDADYVALANFRFSLREFQAFSERKAIEHGLTPQQHQALLVIRAAPPELATVGRVAERLVMKPHSATGLVDRLVMQGFVRRYPSPNDRRQTLLQLTDQARTVLEALSSTHREEIIRLRPMLLVLLAALDNESSSTGGY